MRHFFSKEGPKNFETFQGGINFGPGWRVELDMEVSEKFHWEVLGETAARVTSVPSAPSAPAEEAEEPLKRGFFGRVWV